MSLISDGAEGWESEIRNLELGTLGLAREPSGATTPVDPAECRHDSAQKGRVIRSL